LRTLIVGLGRAGGGLHLPVLTRLRETSPETLFSDQPIVAYDPRPPGTPAPAGVTVVSSLAAAVQELDPEWTVVHVCTPPTGRPEVLAELVDAGFRRFVVEKPLATGPADLAEVLALRDRHSLDIVVVAPWLAAGLTRRLTEVVRDRRYGALREINVAQHKPRFSRTLTAPGHPSAFDVELPHSVAVVLGLAGQAELAAAAWAPLHCADHTVPGMGGAWLMLRHVSGAHSTLRSDLMSPVRDRRITLRFADAVVTGHYPLSADDHHAQFVVTTGGREHREVFPDDALTAFFLAAYRHFHGQPEPDVTGLDRHVDSVRLLAEAKAWCAAREPVTADVC
jgi:predicted dehydrogenase